MATDGTGFAGFDFLAGGGNDDAANGVGSGAGEQSNPLGAIDPAIAAGGDDNGDGFDPAIHVGRDKRNADGSYRRKRGRRGSANSGPRASRASAKTSVNVNAVETALVGIHAMAAAMLKAEELALDADESKPYALAVAEVAKHYDVPQIADKTLAWCGLLFMMGRIYGPRVVLIRERLKAEQAQNVSPGEGVIQFPFGPQSDKAS